MGEQVDISLVVQLSDLKARQEQAKKTLKDIEKQIEVLDMMIVNDLEGGKTSKYVRLESNQVKDRISWKDEMIKTNGARVIELEQNPTFHIVQTLVIDEDTLVKEIIGIKVVE